ncbi:ribulokinase [Bacillus niameyensis]|uniref:ribulokinase n=1 Tax=Bacillus niameyensis TaxID=1522308 RepID=UPI0007811A42|nr:ribulokinase [Bacillus niameyensis]
MNYSIGIDFGTASGRVLIVNIHTGEVVGMSVCPYKHGVIEENFDTQKIPADYSLQNSIDYLDVLKKGVPEAIYDAKVDPQEIVGIGIGFTSSTMIVTDQDFTPLSWNDKYKNNPHAYVKLWKHHGAKEETDRILDVAHLDLNRYLGTYGFNVSSEWMIPKILELKNKAPDILKEAAYIMEAGDWVVSLLLGKNVRSNCARGFKSFWNEENGFDFDFFEKIDEDLSMIIKEKFDGELVKVGQSAGNLTDNMSELLGLRANMPVAPAIIDAHAALLGIGAVKPNQFTMVMGTSTCHLMLHDKQSKIQGISGSVKDAIIPGLYAYEAGQSAVGDLFEWVNKQVPKEYVSEAERQQISIFDLLEIKASQKGIGETGLIALDWHNGNRSPLSNSDLSGILIGLTLHTKIEDIYRAYIEATAFGTKMIMNSYEYAQLEVYEVFACGGIPKKNALLLQIYADILNKPIHVSDSDYAPAVGAAILGAVASGEYERVCDAVTKMKQPLFNIVKPNPINVAQYDQLFHLYEELHQYFGIQNKKLMKRLVKCQYNGMAIS